MLNVGQTIVYRDSDYLVTWDGDATFQVYGHPTYAPIGEVDFWRWLDEYATYGSHTFDDAKAIAKQYFNL